MVRYALSEEAHLIKQKSGAGEGVILMSVGMNMPGRRIS